MPNDNHNYRRSLSADRPALGPTGSRTRSNAIAKAGENHNRSRTRFADRRRKRGRILIALTVLCAAELVYAFLSSPAMYVKHTIIEGVSDASDLTNDEIDMTRRSAALPVGTNWLLAPVGRMHDRLIALPWIRSARIGRHFPTDVSIVIEPRTPSYALITPAGRYEAAADSTPIRPLRKEMENRLIPVVLNSSEVPIPGTEFASISARTSAQILVRTQLDPVLRIAKIEIDQSTNIWLNMFSGVRIKFGNCERVDEKIAMMRRLLSHDRTGRFAEINVSNPEWPAGRLREPERL